MHLTLHVVNMLLRRIFVHLVLSGAVYHKANEEAYIVSHVFHCDKKKFQTFETLHFPGVLNALHVLLHCNKWLRLLYLLSRK